MIAYDDAANEMVRQIPELRPCYERVVDDGDDFEGEPPGQYMLLNDVLGVCLDVLASLPNDIAIVYELTRRALAVGEQLLASDNPDAQMLGIDSVAERLDLFPGGRRLVERAGGPRTRAWFTAHGRTGGPWRDPAEIIDLWGVREQLALATGIALVDLPGVSEPARHHELGSLDDARLHPQGSVLLAAYGTSHLLVAARASIVECDEEHLRTLATELAPLWHVDKHRADAAAGNPGPRYFAIPANERVWNMHEGTVRHARFSDELWIDASLRDHATSIRTVLADR